jgi:hypothetical protein
MLQSTEHLLEDVLIWDIQLIIDKMSKSRLFETIIISKVGCPPKVVFARKRKKTVRTSATCQ